jgi:two-component system cell cycle sensor histidine kinase/response regulator CckA
MNGGRSNGSGSERVAEGQELLGPLAAGIAHEFNNLLTALRGHLELARGRGESDARLTACLDKAAQCTTRAAALSRRLLELSHPERFSPRPVDLRQLVAATASSLRGLLEPDVELEVTVGDCACPVAADRRQIEQILAILVLHARGSMPRGGKVAVGVSEVEMGPALLAGRPWMKPGRYAQLEVRDSGKGIPYEEQSRIFDPFFVSAERPARTGLSLVYGVVKQHRGYIELRSRPGAETSFRILLPWVVGPAQRLREGARPPSRPKRQHRPPTVLLVDDEELVRDLARTVLEGSGFRVLPASKASEAEELFLREGERIDLLLTDLVLPGRSGRELAQSLHHLDPELKILFTSGYDVRGLPEHLAPEPGTAFLQKPYTLRELATKVREVVRE